ncbi:MAG: DUF6288 domain-containing protein, partial [Pirellula sp.]
MNSRSVVSVKAQYLALILAVYFGLTTSVTAAPPNKQQAVPDFTKGDSIPENAKHDWNLGPTGLRGWIYCDKLVTKDARQIRVTSVAEGSPADGSMAVGDVILGVAGQAFSFDPRTEMGRAITTAESDTSDGKLRLTRWRSGVTEEVEIVLPVLGSFSTTAPYQCSKSRHIFENGLKALAHRMSEPDYVQSEDAIPRSLNALALLAS